MKLPEILALVAESEKTGRPIQVRSNDKWRDIKPVDDLDWWIQAEYRVAPPEPPKPREWWLKWKPDENRWHGFEVHADDVASGYIRVREVL